MRVKGNEILRALGKRLDKVEDEIKELKEKVNLGISKDTVGSAKEWIVRQLIMSGDGFVSVKEIKSEAREAGIGVARLRRAKQELEYEGKTQLIRSKHGFYYELIDKSSVLD